MRGMPYASITTAAFPPETLIVTQDVHGTPAAVPVWAITTTVTHVTTNGDFKKVRIDVTWAERNVVRQHSFYHVVSPGWQYAAYMAGIPGEYPNDWEEYQQ
jgi:hypothetical protein